jgi:hypothetical protein
LDISNGYPQVASCACKATFLLLVLGFTMGVIRVRMVSRQHQIFTEQSLTSVQDKTSR